MLAVWQSLIERRGTAPEGENLRAGEFQAGCHVRPYHSSAARTWLHLAGAILLICELSSQSHTICRKLCSIVRRSHRRTACVSRAPDGRAFPTEMAFYRIRDRKMAGRQASRLHAVLGVVVLMSCYEFRVR